MWLTYDENSRRQRACYSLHRNRVFVYCTAALVDGWMVRLFVLRQPTPTNELLSAFVKPFVHHCTTKQHAVCPRRFMTLSMRRALCCRVSNSPGYPGNQLEFFLLEILEFYWNFVRSAGNFMVLYSVLRLIWRNEGCWLLRRFSPRCHGKNRIECA